MKTRFKASVMATAILTVAFTSAADDTAVLREPADDTPKFTLTGETQATHIETVWESDLSNADDYEMGHWLFVHDGVIYAVVEVYGTEYDALIQMRRFDAATGEPILTDDGEPFMTITLPDQLKRSNSANQAFVNSGFITDDDGVPVMVTVRHGDGNKNSHVVAIYLSILDFDNQEISKTLQCEGWSNPDIASQEISAQYIGNIGNVHGSCVEGTLSFEFMLGGKKSNKEPNPNEHLVFSQNGDNYFYHLYDYDYSQPTHTFLGRVDDSAYVMSGQTDEVILSTHDAYNHQDHAIENLFDFAETHPEIVPQGDSGYFFTPVDHNGHRLWLAAKEISADNGIQFNLMEWTEPTTFANLKPLAALPATPFAYGEKHYRARYQLQACLLPGTSATPSAPDTPDPEPDPDTADKPADTPNNQPGNNAEDSPKDTPQDNPDAPSDDNHDDVTGDNPGNDSENNPGDNSNDDSGDNPGNNPGNDSGDNSSDDSGDNPGNNPGNDSGSDSENDPDNDSTSESPVITEFILYAPGTGIGRYRLVTAPDGTHDDDTSALTPVGVSTSAAPYHLVGRTLTLAPDAIVATIHDLSGRRLLTFRTQTADLTPLPAGLYLLTISTPMGPRAAKLLLR